METIMYLYYLTLIFVFQMRFLIFSFLFVYNFGLPYHHLAFQQATLEPNFTLQFIPNFLENLSFLLISFIRLFSQLTYPSPYIQAHPTLLQCQHLPHLNSTITYPTTVLTCGLFDGSFIISF